MAKKMTSGFGAGKSKSGYGAAPQSARRAASAGAVSAAESHNSKKMRSKYRVQSWVEDDGIERGFLEDTYTKYNRTSYGYKPEPKVQMRKKPAKRRKSGGGGTR